MKKQSLLAFIAHFEKELSALVQSAKAAHFAATHEESRAEDKHDTFAIESSYLAAGQAERVRDIRKALAELGQYLTSSVQNPSRVELGTLVGLESAGKKTYVFMAKYGGGTQVQIMGMTVSLMSQASPIGEHLEGLSVGDSFELESRIGPRESRIIEIT